MFDNIKEKYNNISNEKKAYFRHIVKIVCLVLVLMLLYEATSIIIQVQEETTMLSYIETMREQTIAENPDLNPNTFLWVVEIEYLQSTLPEGIEDFNTVIKQEEWNSELTAVIKEISEGYVSDADIAQKIIDIVPARYHKIAFRDCFQNITKYVDGTLFEKYR